MAVFLGIVVVSSRDAFLDFWLFVVHSKFNVLDLWSRWNLPSSLDGRIFGLRLALFMWCFFSKINPLVNLYIGGFTPLAMLNSQYTCFSHIFW